MMKKYIIPLALVILLVGSSYGLTVNLIKQDGTVDNLLYYDLSTKTYKDAVANVNPDLGIEVCDNVDPAGKWVALFYSLNGSSIAVSKNLSSNAGVMVKLGGSYSKNGLTCANATPDKVSIIDSIISDPYGIEDEPAYFPAKVWAAVDSSPDLSNPTFIPTNITFLGHYSLNNYQSTYDNSNGEITLFVNGISANTPSISVSVSEPNSSLIVGVCDDSQGIHCQDVKNFTQSELQNGVLLNTGHNNLTDQNAYNIYVLINGIPHDLGLGADLMTSNIIVDHTPVFYGEAFNTTVYITNVGNINVTHPFNVSLTFWRNVYGTTYQNVTLTKTYSGVIQPGQTISLKFNYIAKPNGTDAFSQTGIMTMVAKSDIDNNIKEINENNNILTSIFDYKPDYEPSIKINGNETMFPYSGRVYNVTFSFMIRPNNTIQLPSYFILVKDNGYNIFVPSENSNINFTRTIIGIDGNRINSNGKTSITLPVIPLKSNTTFGKNEQIYIQIPGGKILDPSIHKVVDKYYLRVLNVSYEQPTSTAIAEPNNVGGIFSLVYKLYSNIFGEIGI